MENKIKEIFTLLSSSINREDIQKGDFYKKTLTDLSNVIQFDYGTIYFVDADSFVAKQIVSVDTETLILNEKIHKCIAESEKPTFVLEKLNYGKKNYKYSAFSKLLIRKSVYGVVVIARDTEFSELELLSFETYSAVFSYLIKDYELNDVFKMQLKTLQETIIEKNNAYDVIEKQHKKLIELDKTKNAFLANISHELRTPLNAIIGFSQALGCKIFGDLNEKQEEYIKDIQISGLHLLGMINEILDLSKIESKAMKISLSELDAAVVIQEGINILTPLFEQKSIKVNFSNQCKKHIMADYQKLQQILYNLLSNAIKFTPEKGKIDIRISTSGKDFILEVQDNGIGIDKKYHNKIFTKFVHLNNLYTKPQNSTGLGLTITKELVKLHKGKITLESAVGKGTVFRVQLKGTVIA